jgi:hypothetical protein
MVDKTLLYGGLTLIVLCASLIIGGTVIDKTINVSGTIAPGGTVTTALVTDVTTSMQTFGGFLPVAVIGLVGAVALFYLMNLMRGSQSQ